MDELSGEVPLPERAELRRGWCLGSESFRERMLELLDGAGTGAETGARQGGKGAVARGRTQSAASGVRRDASVRRDHGEVEAKRLLARGLEAMGLGGEDLEKLPRGDERKAALAAELRTRTVASNGWAAAALAMGHPSRVTHCLKMPESHPLRRRLQAALGR